MSTNYVPRVTQVDALLLDLELSTLLQNKVMYICNSFKVGGWAQKYFPELKFLIKLALWKLNTYQRNATFGQALLRVKLACDKPKLKMLLLLEAVVPYIHERVGAFLSGTNGMSKFEKTLQYMEDGNKILEILNFLSFLLQNKYPTLIYRILNVTMKPTNNQANNSVGFFYQLREMLWHQFADFLMILLPIINIHRIKRFLRDWKFNSNSLEKTKAADKNDSTNLICCICNQDAVIPQYIGSSCVCCYYCLNANLMADSEFRPNNCRHQK